MLDVQYDHEMLAYVDGILERSAETLQAAAQMLTQYQGLTDGQFAALEAMRSELGVWLAKYEKGYWVPADARAEMRRHEAGASDILEDPNLNRIVFEDEEDAA